MDLDRELENLSQNSEEELSKVRRTRGERPPREPSRDTKPAPNNSAPNEKGSAPVPAQQGSAPNEKGVPAQQGSAPNEKGAPNEKEGGSSESGKQAKAVEGGNIDTSDKYEMVYTILEKVLGALIPKMKWLVLMPYAFFMNYVYDFMDEHKYGEQPVRKVDKAILATILVVVYQTGLMFIFDKTSFIKNVPVLIGLVLCMMDSDKTKK